MSGEGTPHVGLNSHPTVESSPEASAPSGGQPAAASPQIPAEHPQPQPAATGYSPQAAVPHIPMYSSYQLPYGYNPAMGYGY